MHEIKTYLGTCLLQTFLLKLIFTKIFFLFVIYQMELYMHVLVGIVCSLFQKPTTKHEP